MPEARRGPTATRVPGVRVGHAADPAGSSGVTVVRFGHAAPTVIDARGGATGTFDTASLALEATFGRRFALFLSGGSLYGLDAGRGVRRALLDDGEGTPFFGSPHPIVQLSGAILFDLPERREELPDYESLGYRAARSASRAPVPTGAVGAGAGATIGKYLGRERAAPGGVGSAARDLGPFGWVGVVAAVNSVGAIRDPSTGRWVAGPRDAEGEVVPLPMRPPRTADGARGTTLVVVAVELTVDRAVLQRVAVAAHDGLARVVEPCHTATDGDVVFVASTEKLPTRRTPEARPGEVADRLSSATSALVVEAVLRSLPTGPGRGRRRSA